MKFYLGVDSYSRVIALCLNFDDFSVLSPNWVISGCNFMKLVLNIYDHSVAMPFDCLNFNDFFHVLGHN